MSTRCYLVRSSYTESASTASIDAADPASERLDSVDGDDFDLEMQCLAGQRWVEIHF
jgi:hypothetical protein